jgi:hypothetical protein
MSEFGLWTRRVIALSIVFMMGYYVWLGRVTEQDLQTLLAMIVGFYFGSSKEDT